MTLNLCYNKNITSDGLKYICHIRNIIVGDYVNLTLNGFRRVTLYNGVEFIKN